MDFAQLGLSATDGVSINKASGSGVVVSGAADELDGASLSLANALTFDKNKPVGRICLDGVAPMGATVAVDVCFDDLEEPVARFTLRNQEIAGSWEADGDLTHDALGDVPAGKQRVSLRLSVSGVSAGENVTVLLRSIEFAQSSLPTIYLNLDATESDISAENKQKGYGTLAEMLGSRDHDVRCAGSASFIVPDGFKDDSGIGQESFTADLEYVRGRGNSTWDENRPKKPFKFKFAKKRALFGMGKNKHWVLLANSFDGSLVRDRLTSWIGNEIGLEYTYKCVPVDLVVNEVFYGSYLLCEQVRVDGNRVDTSAAYVLNECKDSWLDQLMGDPIFTTKLKEFWKGTLKKTLAEVTEKGGLLDHYYDEKLVSWCYDREKWGDSLYAEESAIESGADIDMSFKGEIEWLKWWFNHMSALTDNVIDELGDSRCMVTFVVDGKKTGQTSVVANETMTRVPDAPAKEGYVFVGWYLPSGAQATPGSTVFAKDTTLTAHYVEAAKATPATHVFFKNAHVCWPDNGDPFKPSYTIVPYTAEERSITWSSSNEAVAKVDASGAVSPYGLGTATIKATLKSGKTFSYTFQVLDRTDIGPASSPKISVKPSSLVLVEGGVAQIKAATNARDTANEMFAFEPKDSRIVSIDENGVVTGQKPGKTTVAVEDFDHDVKATCAVTVKPRDPNLSGEKLVLSKTKYVYNGKVQRPKVKTVGGRKLEAGVDYRISWSTSKSKTVGVYRLKVIGKGLYKGTSAAAKYKIVRAKNPLKVTGKTVKLKASKLRARSLSVAKGKAFKVLKNRSFAKLMFKKMSGNAKIKVSTGGKVTVKKGLKPGTYRVKVKASQRASKNYKARTIKGVVLKVKVV